ncbi:MAG: O-antigen ligase family protein, partial [Saprospiraceae bacterium]
MSTNNLYIVLIVTSILSAFALNQPLLLGIPVVALLVYVALVDFKSLFYCLFALIPLSFEYNFPNGLGTDLPDEPLMWLLTGVAGVYLLANLKNLSARFFLHPITLLLFLHLIWFFISTVQAQSIVFSLKFFAAKIWYVVCFYFLGYFILRTPAQRKRLFWLVLIPLLITVIIV